MQDLWNKKKPKSDLIDLMYINHFAIYNYIGYIYPDNYCVPIILSILWEIFEIILVSFNPVYEKISKLWVVPEKYWNEHSLHKMIDIVVNCSGYYVGSKLNKNKSKKSDIAVTLVTFAVILSIILLTNYFGE
jgi:hypothetical protein